MQLTNRVSSEDVSINGVHVPSGSLIFLALGSANRDPRKFGPDADRFVVGREDARHTMSFGHGAHYCLGSHMALAEAKAVLDAIGELGVEWQFNAEPTWTSKFSTRGIEQASVRFS